SALVPRGRTRGTSTDWLAGSRGGWGRGPGGPRAARGAGGPAGRARGGGVAVALKRASLLGRAPVVTDLPVAFTIWGFLGEPPDELIELRRPLFAEVANPHHYPAQRRIADLVSGEVLRMSPQEIAEAHRDGW